MYGALAGSVILVFSLWDVVQARRLYAWLGVFVVVQIPRHILKRSFASMARSDEDAIWWGRWFLVGSGMTALIWGLTAVFIFPETSFTHQCLLAAILAGVVASTAVAHAPVQAAYATGAVLVMAPLSARFIYEGGQLQILLGAVGVVYTTAVIGSARALHNFISETIRLRFEKDGLIESLQTARTRLEARVAERAAILTQQNLQLEREITERIRAEEELRKSEARYRQILETIADGYHEVDLAGNVTFANDSLCDIIGYPREELIGMSFRRLMDPGEAERVLAAYNEVFRTGEPKPIFAFHVTRKDGMGKDISVSVTLIRDSLGEPTGFRGILRDITEQKLLEEQLRQAVKMEAIGRMAGGIAHDFNNLLTAIMGYSKLLISESPPDWPHLDKLRQIRRASKRAAELTSQLLAYSRKQMLDVRVLNVNSLIRDTERMLQRIIGEDIELVTVLDGDLANISADPSQMEQIVMNMAVNARDAMPQGGRLTIETRNTFLDDAYASAHAEVTPGPHVMLAVSDTGHGMVSETCAKVFDPFFTTKAKGAGTGLGLSTVYGIVKQHGGHVTVYSEPDKGTVFKVYFPCVEGPADPSAITSRAIPMLHGTETVLIVEDEEAVLDLAADALGLFGYTTLTASSPAKALEIAETHEGPIHLLLTDVVLPQMDGKSLFQRLSVRRPDTKVLFMSGYTEDFIVHHGVLDRGVNFLHKPFDVEGLVTRTRTALDGPANPEE
jgi:PAS domain S-box-containing protein